MTDRLAELQRDATSWAQEDGGGVGGGIEMGQNNNGNEVEVPSQREHNIMTFFDVAMPSNWIFCRH